MKKQTSSDELKMLIIKAEEKNLRLKEEIKSGVNDFIEQFKPANLIKRGISSIAQTEHLKEKAVKGGLGIAAGFLFKKLFFKNIKRSLALGLTGIVARQLITQFATLENIEKLGEKISGALSKMKDKRKGEPEEVWS